MTRGTPVIELRGVTFSYGALPVLTNVDLSVERGEFLGIVGPNAGGKTTLLKVILGLLEPLAGTVRVLGKPPRPARGKVGYLPQHPGFPRDFPITVEQAVLTGRLGTGSSWGRYSGADRTAARRALDEVEAADLAHRAIGELSGGQLQRVLLARALACEPEILILDEPTAHIDVRIESDVFDLLKELNQRMTILVVSHDVGFVASHVERVACVNRTLVCHRTEEIDGRIMQDLYGQDLRAVAHHHHG
jgi:zinc transport system ATP-binding protein